MANPHSGRTPIRCVTCRLRKVKCSGGAAPCHNCRRLRLNCTFPRPGDGIMRAMSLGTPTEALTEAGTARRRITAACHRCRARKSKCDGQKPQCQRCQQNNFECTYPEDNSRLWHHEHRRSIQSAGQVEIAAAPTSSPPAMEPLAAHETPSLDVSQDRSFLSREVLSQHIEAYFVYIYHIPGYNFFHRPSLLEDLYHDKIPPILSTAICATVSGYLNRSRVGKQMSVEWATNVNSYLSTNLNNLTLLNLQLMVLSLYQHLAYRQFGRSWLILGMATRLALGIQLNKDSRLCPESDGVAVRECQRRLAWGIFIQDKLHAGGIEEFVGMPGHWMHIALPLEEDDFLRERSRRSTFLSDDLGDLPQEGIGISAYIVVLMQLRHEILQVTKRVIAKTSSSQLGDTAMIASLLSLETRMKRFHATLPSHLRLTDRNLFAYSSSSELIAFVSLHTWYLQASCDLFRICLPGMSRESALSSLLIDAPLDLVDRWRCSAVSYAKKLASIWQHFLKLSSRGGLKFPGNLLPLDPANCVSIHQITKILLAARRFKLYNGLFDPLTELSCSLNDEEVIALCQSNLAYIKDFASIAPIATAVERDVRVMIASDISNASQRNEMPNVEEETPVTSQTQKDHALSRYNVLAMGIAASSSNPSPSDEGYALSTTSDVSVAGQDLSAVRGRSATNHTVDYASHQQDRTFPSSIPQQSVHSTSYPPPHVTQQQHNMEENTSSSHTTTISVPGQQQWGNCANPGLETSYPPIWSLDYSVPGSQFDMNGELDWFLMNSIVGSE